MAGIKMKISHMEETTKRKRRERNSSTSVHVLDLPKICTFKKGKAIPGQALRVPRV
jgi:hypothetical protein